MSLFNELPDSLLRLAVTAGCFSLARARPLVLLLAAEAAKRNFDG